MTLTVNLHNCSGWAVLTTYAVGDRRSNDTAPVKAYQCITAGMSASVGGPTGTGASVSDGTAVWKYLSAVDYTSMPAAIAGLGTLTQPAIINPWNDAEWVISNVVVSGNSTTSSNTLTIKPAPGEGFRDAAGAATNPLRYDITKGVGFANNTNYNGAIQINQDWTSVVGLQIKGNATAGSPGSSGGAAALGTGAGPNSIYDSCILDTSLSTSTVAYALSDSAPFSGNCVVKNSAIIVRALANGIRSAYGMNVYSCTVVRIGAASPSGTAFGHDTSTVRFIKDTAAFGFTTLEGVGGPSTATTNATDIASPPTGWTGSLTYANQFVNTGATVANRDFRLKAGAGLLDIATTDTTNIPTAVDIVGTARPQGSAWDIGAWELVAAAAAPSGRPMSVQFGSLRQALLAGVALAVMKNPSLGRRDLFGRFWRLR